jgi:hypothetical protein
MRCYAIPPARARLGQFAMHILYAAMHARACAYAPLCTAMHRYAMHYAVCYAVRYAMQCAMQCAMRCIHCHSNTTHSRCWMRKWCAAQWRGAEVSACGSARRSRHDARGVTARSSVSAARARSPMPSRCTRDLAMPTRDDRVHGLGRGRAWRGVMAAHGARHDAPAALHSRPCLPRAHTRRCPADALETWTCQGETIVYARVELCRTRQARRYDGGACKRSAHMAESAPSVSNSHAAKLKTSTTCATMCGSERYVSACMGGMAARRHGHTEPGSGREGGRQAVHPYLRHARAHDDGVRWAVRDQARAAVPVGVPLPAILLSP